MSEPAVVQEPIKLPIELERPFTYAEAAKVCRVSVVTIKDWAYTDQVPRYRVRGQHYRLVPASVVRRWLERRLIRCRTKNGDGT